MALLGSIQLPTFQNRMEWLKEIIEQLLRWANA